MNCKNCGAPLSEKDAFCKKCGSLVGFDSIPTATSNSTNIPGAIDFSNGSQATITNEEIIPPMSQQPMKQDTISTPNTPNQNIFGDFAQMKPTETPKTTVPKIEESKEQPIIDPITPPVKEPKISPQESFTPVPPNPPLVEPKPMEKDSHKEIIPPISVETGKKETPAFHNELPVNPEEPEPEIDEIKRSKKGLIIVIILAVIILIVGIVFGIKYFNDKKSQSEVDKPNVSNVDKYRINFLGYMLEVPEDYIYTVAGNKLYVSDSQNTWYAAIQMTDMEYDTVVSKSKQIATTYQKSGFKIGNAEEKNIGNRKYYAVELQSGDKYALAVYSKAVSNRVFALVAYNPTYTIDYAILENISSILDSAVYLGEPGTITQTSSVDVLTPLK